MALHRLFKVRRHNLLCSVRPTRINCFMGSATSLLLGFSCGRNSYLELKERHIICSDILSTLQGIQNFCNGNNLLFKIRHLCIKTAAKLNCYGSRLIWEKMGTISRQSCKISRTAPCHTIIPGVQKDI